ncbi:MAG TPA: Qat anti-phage system QueC-like protein QatC [Puia sp.]|jgi:7-cyano-7-deazaguanine synthase in queuosine biosynthesis
MAKLALVAFVGQQDDGPAVENTLYGGVGRISFFKYNNVQDVSVHEFLKVLKQLRLEPSELLMDLLVIACTMYAADTRIKREAFAEDSWTRQIDLYIPVSDETFWNGQKVLLQKIFRFLTGDIWEVNFRARAQTNLLLSPRGHLARYGMTYQTDTVCLFSGGMDSLIGAVDLLEAGSRPLLVGHAKSGDTTIYQENCFHAVQAEYPNLQPARVYAFVRVPKNGLFGSEDNTERGRSFLFLTLGAICAGSLQSQSRLIVPENGMISLNIPLTPLRVGSHSTRTTHPYYFQMMQQLFNNMQNGVQIQNPYQFKTKGEMLAECSNSRFVANTHSMSCSHPVGRWQGHGLGHCGYCVPCIIRIAAYRHAGLPDTSNYRRNILNGTGLDITEAEGADVLAFKYLIEKIRRRPDFLVASIRNTGPLGDDITRFVDVYRRALQEVENLLAHVALL